MTPNLRPVLRPVLPPLTPRPNTLRQATLRREWWRRGPAPRSQFRPATRANATASRAECASAGVAVVAAGTHETAARPGSLKHPHFAGGLQIGRATGGPSQRRWKPGAVCGGMPPLRRASRTMRPKAGPMSWLRSGGIDSEPTARTAPTATGSPVHASGLGTMSRRAAPRGVSGAYRLAVPTPVIDPRFVNGVGVHRAPSGFSLCGDPPGACSPAR